MIGIGLTLCVAFITILMGTLLLAKGEDLLDHTRLTRDILVTQNVLDSLLEDAQRRIATGVVEPESVNTSGWEELESDGTIVHHGAETIPPLQANPRFPDFETVTAFQFDEGGVYSLISIARNTRTNQWVRIGATFASSNVTGNGLVRVAHHGTIAVSNYPALVVVETQLVPVDPNPPEARTMTGQTQRGSSAMLALGGGGGDEEIPQYEPQMVPKPYAYHFGKLNTQNCMNPNLNLLQNPATSFANSCNDGPGGTLGLTRSDEAVAFVATSPNDLIAGNPVPIVSTVTGEGTVNFDGAGADLYGLEAKTNAPPSFSVPTSSATHPTTYQAQRNYSSSALRAAESTLRKLRDYRANALDGDNTNDYEPSTVPVVMFCGTYNTQQNFASPTIVYIACDTQLRGGIRGQAALVIDNANAASSLPVTVEIGGYDPYTLAPNTSPILSLTGPILMAQHTQLVVRGSGKVVSGFEGGGLFLTFSDAAKIPRVSAPNVEFGRSSQSLSLAWLMREVAKRKALPQTQANGVADLDVLRFHQVARSHH